MNEIEVVEINGVEDLKQSLHPSGIPVYLIPDVDIESSRAGDTLINGISRGVIRLYGRLYICTEIKHWPNNLPKSYIIREVCQIGTFIGQSFTYKDKASMLKEARDKLKKTCSISHVGLQFYCESDQYVIIGRRLHVQLRGREQLSLF